ncbi:MAG TPA: hypothetical protein VIQ31_25955, partial [Phormidium sp.]
MDSTLHFHQANQQSPRTLLAQFGFDQEQADLALHNLPSIATRSIESSWQSAGTPHIVLAFKLMEK